MKLQQHFECFYERTYGVKPVFLVESQVYALHNQQLAYECFLNGYSCVRRDEVALEFNPDFMMWALTVSLRENQELQFLCNGWEM